MAYKNERQFEFQAYKPSDYESKMIEFLTRDIS